MLFDLSGHGRFDMQTFQDYRTGKLVEREYGPSEVGMALAGLPSVA